MKCPKCLFEIRGGKIFEKHFAYCDGTGPRAAKPRKSGGRGWSKNLTKTTDPTLAKISTSLTGKMPWCFGQTLSIEHRESISSSMKVAHEEDRAYNIGSSRWKNEPSYPEKFFAQVIQNEFSDKNVTLEFPFKRYSLDFAWVHLKKVIEIDGEQHDRPKQKTSDAKKDALLQEAGWQIHRVRWQEMFHNPKEQILLCKQFLESSGV